jgi:hypothetical protein
MCEINSFNFKPIGILLALFYSTNIRFNSLELWLKDHINYHDIYSQIQILSLGCFKTVINTVANKINRKLLKYT